MNDKNMNNFIKNTYFLSLYFARKNFIGIDGIKIVNKLQNLVQSTNSKKKNDDRPLRPELRLNSRAIPCNGN